MIASAKTGSTIIELKDIVKRFPGVVANNHVNFDLKKGEVHCLLGENGAGKTVLMSVLYGLQKPDGERYVFAVKERRSILLKTPSNLAWAWFTSGLR